MRFDPTRPDLAPYGLTCEKWTPSLMRRPDRHNEIELNLLEHGSMTYLLGGRKMTLEAGRLTAFWATLPHQIIGATGRSSYFVATVPLAWFLQWQLPERFVEPILHGEVVCEAGKIDPREDVRRFERWLRDLGGRSAERRRAAVLEMQARLVRMASKLPPTGRRLSRPARRRAGPPVAGMSKAEQMACFIAQHYLEPISVAEISQSVRLHPNYAMNLFKDVFASTFTTYITQHRLSHAQRLLATTEDKILAVALSSGFGSVSRFNDAFRRACGCSPRQYRQQHRL